jgi:O-antigen ligase
MLGSLAVLYSGYRSAVINSFFLVIAAAIRDLKAAAVVLIPLLAALFFALSVVNSEIVALPKQVQRGLAFLPGHWDVQMARDAESSNIFRLNVWSIWWKQYFPAQPIFGRGFGFKSEWSKQSIYYGKSTDLPQMVETGNLHNGFLASLDTFGIVGTVFFVTWNVSLFVRALRVPFDHRGKEYFTLRFLALYLAVSTASYWIGALHVGTFLPQEFALTGLFLRLLKELLPAQSHVPHPEEPALTPFRRELLRA